MATLHIDLTSYPLVLCRLEAAPTGIDTLGADFARYTEQLLGQRGEFVVLHDWSNAAEPSDEVRDSFFDQVIRNPALADRCLGHFVISRSDRTRHMLTALSWLRPVPYPFAVTGAPEAALRCARGQLNVRTMDFMSRLERNQAGLDQMGF